MPFTAVANRSLYRTNPFRITGLAIDASVKEISRLTDRLKMMAELGSVNDHQQFAFALSPAPSADQIRDASQILRDPEKRIVHSFFWFWPEPTTTSKTDPALQALANGDHATAYDLWLSRENDHQHGHVAMHNLAVMFHMLALDWTDYHLVRDVSKEKENIIETYWKEAAERWRAIADEDRAWETVREQARALDDARVTTGIVRRMAASMTSAFTKIHAEIALQFAERGRKSDAEAHVNFLKTIGGKSKDAERAIDEVLAPKKTWIKHQVERAKKTAPEEGCEAAKRLLAETKPYSYLFGLFYSKTDYQYAELFEEVGRAALKAIISYQYATGDDQNFVAVLTAINDFATGSLRKQVDENINIGKRNLQFDAIQKRLEEFEKSRTPPKTKFEILHDTLIPDAVTLEFWCEMNGATDVLMNRIAIVLREISVDAFNTDDIDTAKKACAEALSLCKDEGVKQRLEQDQAQLQKLITQAEAMNVRLKVGDHQLAIVKEGITHNKKFYPVHQIRALRIGLKTLNGIPGYCMFDFATMAGEVVHITWLDPTTTTWLKIINGAVFHIGWVIAERIGKTLKAGGVETVGKVSLRKSGMTFTTGVLAWKTEHLVPYNYLKFKTASGDMTVSDSRNPKLSCTIPVREEWNAVILEEIVKTIIKK